MKYVQNNAYVHAIFNAYSSTLYIGMALHYSVLKEIFDYHFQLVNAYMCSKGTKGVNYMTRKGF